ncbi:hypothetical protein EVAR_2330_1 [Eumeta japonica]|uniref:Uncharacterized protein n=1 Tax=Eumeta variegata TaxID=151549 RepID=A0A4C1SGP5_EUMVA|nr:hypothetical protein EVAR_2330_1 [Eumeta japonica]
MEPRQLYRVLVNPVDVDRPEGQQNSVSQTQTNVPSPGETLSLTCEVLLLCEFRIPFPYHHSVPSAITPLLPPSYHSLFHHFTFLSIRYSITTRETSNALVTSLGLQVSKISDCEQPLSLFYSDASADTVKERSLIPRSRSHARLRPNTTMSHAFSYVRPTFIDL